MNIHTFCLHIISGGVGLVRDLEKYYFGDVKNICVRKIYAGKQERVHGKQTA